MAGLDGWRRWGCAIALGFLAALSLPPVNAWPLLFMAIPAFWVLAESQQGKWRASFWLGWSFGFGYFLFALHWIGFAFLVDAQDFLWMMPFAVLGLVSFMAIYWGVAVAACHLLGRRGLGGFMWLCVTIGIAEYLRGRLLTGFPWGAPGLAVDGMGPVAQTAALFGMEGLTPLVFMWAGVWPFAVSQERRSGRVIAGLLLATLPVLAGLGLVRLAKVEAPAMPPVTVRIVQPNIPQSDKWRGDNMQQIFDELLSLSSRPATGAGKPSVIIWPESAVPYLLDESPESLSLIGEMLGPGRMLMTGSLRRIKSPGGVTENDRVFNSVMAIDGDGRLAGLYDKWKLVPGGEFLPFEWLLAPLGFRKVVTLPGSFEAGRGPHWLAVQGAPPVGISVCYEAIFPQAVVDPSERPGWLLNVTNDGWFGSSTGPYAHLAQARLRSIEQGLPMVRAANTGVSAIIDPYGRYVSRLALGTEGVVDGNLPAPLATTIFGRFGNLGLLLVLALLAGLGVQFSASRR